MEETKNTRPLDLPIGRQKGKHTLTVLSNGEIQVHNESKMLWEIRKGAILFDPEDRDEVMVTIQAVLLLLPRSTANALLTFLNHVWLTKLSPLPEVNPVPVLTWHPSRTCLEQYSYLVAEYQGSSGSSTLAFYPHGAVVVLSEGPAPSLLELYWCLLVYPREDDTFDTWLRRANTPLRIEMPQKNKEFDKQEPPFASKAKQDVSGGQQMCTQPTVVALTNLDLSSTKGKTMEKTVVQTLSREAQDAAWRTSARQLTKLTRDPLVGLISRHLGAEDNESVRKKIADFLSTEAGLAATQALLSIALTSGLMATGSDNEKLNRLAQELRVSAMAEIGDLLAETLMAPLRQVLSVYLQGLPEVAPEEPKQLPSPTSRWTEELKTATEEKVAG